ncbi:MAG: hypothetical protein WBK28_00410 [Minisyncoccia bacterium]
MSTKAIVGLLAAVVVIAGGVWFLSSKGTGNEGDALTGGDDTKQEAEGAGTFMDLMTRAGSWTCSIQTTIENAASEGTTYIADGKIRADFTSSINGAIMTSHMIQADGYIYTWSDSLPQGMKLPIPSSNDPAVSEAVAFDYSQQVDYDCAPWVKDDAKFAPPAEVSFMDPGKFMPPTDMIPEGIPELPEGIPQAY